MRGRLDRLEPGGREPIAHVAGELLVARRSGEMRLASEETVRLADAIGGRHARKKRSRASSASAEAAAKPNAGTGWRCQVVVVRRAMTRIAARPNVTRMRPAVRRRRRAVS